MVEVIVPITAVGFRLGNNLGAGTWTGGPFPYLDSFDADSSYGTTAPPAEGVTAGVAASFTYGATVKRFARFRTQARPSYTNDATFVMQLLAPGFEDADIMYEERVTAAQAPAGQWSTYSATMLDDWINYDPEFVAFLAGHLAAGNLHAKVGITGAGSSIDVSAVEVVVETDTIPPLRQVQRDDGLLRSARRARGGRSRQGSLRQRGYL